MHYHFQEKKKLNFQAKKILKLIILVNYLLLPETYSIIGKLKCKLCKEAMKLVEKEINKDSTKVNLILFQRFIRKLKKS